MKGINAALLATVLFLASVTVAGSYYYQPRIVLHPIMPIVSLVIPSDIYDNPTWALEHGFRGAIKIEYNEPIPDRIFVTKNQSQDFTFTMTFKSFLDSLDEIKVYIGNGTDVGYMGDMIGDYTTYVPSGVISLKTGEVRELHMLLNVPSGLEHGISFPRSELVPVKMHSENGIVFVFNIVNEPPLGLFSP